jgi:predicted transcriptional regulator
MEHEPGIFERHDQQAEYAADLRAWADFGAGRYYEHAVVARWLQTWGTPERVSFREWLAANS